MSRAKRLVSVENTLVLVVAGGAISGVVSDQAAASGAKVLEPSRASVATKTVSTPLSTFVPGRRFSFSIPQPWRIVHQEIPLSNWDKVGVICNVERRRAARESASRAALPVRCTVDIGTELTSRLKRNSPALEGAALRVQTGDIGYVSEERVGKENALGFSDAVMKTLAVPIRGRDNRSVVVDLFFEASDRKAGEEIASSIFRSLRVLSVDERTPHQPPVGTSELSRGALPQSASLPQSSLFGIDKGIVRAAPFDKDKGIAKNPRFEKDKAIVLNHTAPEVVGKAQVESIEDMAERMRRQNRAALLGKP